MKPNQSQELKGLETRLKKAEAYYELTCSDHREAKKKMDEAWAVIQNIKDMIFNLKESTKTPIVTEHAILRYLERQKGIDMDSIHKCILTDKNIEIINQLGTGKITNADGMKIVFKNRTVVTVE